MVNVDELIKQAMKSKNQVELRAYKNLKSEIQVVKTAKNAKPYDEAAEIQLISKMCKKLEDGCKEFSEAGREDLASEYRDELEVLRKLLPEPVNESDIIGALKAWCVMLGTVTFDSKEIDMYSEVTSFGVPKQAMGDAIKYLKAVYPQADGKVISTIVKNYIK